MYMINNMNILRCKNMNKTFNIGQTKISQIKYKNVPTVTITSSALASAATCTLGSRQCYTLPSWAIFMGSMNTSPFLTGLPGQTESLCAQVQTSPRRSWLR